MHRNKKQCLVEQVRRFRARFVQSVDTVLVDVIPRESLMARVIEVAARRKGVRALYTKLGNG